MIRYYLIAVLAALPLAFAGHTAVAQQAKPVCTDNTRECLITAAESYLTAIVTNDGSKALFHPNVRRTQQGNEPGAPFIDVGEAVMRKSMDMEPDMLPHRNTRYFVDEEQQTVIYFTLLPTKASNADPDRESYEVGDHDMTVHLAERFKIEKGLITEIEAIFYRSDSIDNTSGWPDDE